ncbi:MAG: hypothetical protein ACRC8S_12205 [Fimbriiglobus sp.]
MEPSPQRLPIMDLATAHAVNLCPVFGAALICRLRGTIDLEAEREIFVRYFSEVEPDLETQHTFIIEWGHRPSIPDQWLEEFTSQFNEKEVTERAAVALMALLVSALMKHKVLYILPEGVAGDWQTISETGIIYPIEVSGIAVDEDGHELSSRLSGKKKQFMKYKPKRGYVSVTAFAYRTPPRVESVLRYFGREKS